MIKVRQFNKRKKIKINGEIKKDYNFKEISLTKMAKRQLLVTLLSILGVTAISLGSAYAVFTSISKSADYNVIKVGTLNIDFGEGSSNTIKLSGQYPMSDEEGVKLTPYTFTIENTGTLPANYEIFIQDDTDMIEQDNCANNQLNKDYIRYKLDSGNPTNLSSIAGNNYKIAIGSLEPKEKVTYKLYIWIREGVGNDVLNKHYHGKIIVNGTNGAEIATNTLLAKANSEDLDYAAATSEQQKEMWKHTHPETEQTEALTDYRYIGKDPNNYVTFNNETWRIIGIFTVDDGAGNKEERLKIVRDEPIEMRPWNNSVNNWPDASLNYLLNPGHESEAVGGSLYWNSGSGSCYTASGTNACDFTEIGLKEDARNLIGDTLWYLGGTADYTSASNGFTDLWYSYERGTNVYNGNATSWIGKVGLVYPSDVGYATSGGSTTDRHACLNKELSGWADNGYSDCINNDWLLLKNAQWTITPYLSNSTDVFYFVSPGRIVTSNVNFGYISIYPVAFLKSNVVIVSGDGSASNPYILEI